MSFKSISRSGYVLDLSSILIAYSLYILYLKGHAFFLDILRIIMTVIFLTFLIGRALINIVGIAPYLSKLESLLLSYAIGYSVAGLLYLPTTVLEPWVRPLFILHFYVILSLLSFVARRYWYKKRELEESVQGLIGKTDVIVLILCVIYYGGMILTIYPTFFYSAGTDMFTIFIGQGTYVATVQHPLLSLPYLNYVLFAAQLISLTKSNVLYIQFVVSMLNMIMPISIFVLAKKFLNDGHKKLPALATMLWTFYPGLSWMALLLMNLSPVNDPSRAYMAYLWDKTYGEVAMFPSPFLFFVPFSISLTLYMISFIILGLDRLSGRQFFFLWGFIFSGMYLTHVVEALLLLISLGFLSFTSIYRQGINYAINASVLLLMIFTIVSIILRSLPTSFIMIHILVLLTITALIIARRIITPKMKLLLKNMLARSERVLSLVTFSLYMSGLVIWLTTFKEFTASTYANIGIVPWFMYPVFLGPIGALAILTFLISKQERPKSVGVFGLLLFTDLLVGRLASFVNVGFFFTGFLEIRVFYYLTIPIVMLAATSIIHVYRRFT